MPPDLPAEAMPFVVCGFSLLGATKSVRCAIYTRPPQDYVLIGRPADAQRMFDRLRPFSEPILTFHGWLRACWRIDLTPRRPISSKQRMQKHKAQTECSRNRCINPMENLPKGINGTVNLFIFLDAHRPWRKVKVTDRRAAVDFAACMRELTDVPFP